MFDRLDSVVEKFHDIEHSLTRSDLDGREVTKLSKERASLEPLVIIYQEYKKSKSELSDARAMVGGDDDDMRQMALEEIKRLEVEIPALEEKLKVLMLPTDARDEKNVLLEIRAGTGGDEASLFAGDLMRMYLRFADRQGWQNEILSATEGTVGGYKEVVMLISGDRVFSRLKFEAGTHRVQRVPATEAQGRIHTSAVTVAVLPEADEIEVNIDPKDLEITVSRASGAGGQHVNKTDSAVRMVHRPSGIVVECQDERSQIKNRAKALKVLQARLFDKMESERDAAMSADRKAQVGSGDRSERIRTYNFPQGRITDHRINLTLYKLDEFMEGDITEMLSALMTNHQTELLKKEYGDQI